MLGLGGERAGSRRGGRGNDSHVNASHDGRCQGNGDVAPQRAALGARLALLKRGVERIGKVGEALAASDNRFIAHATTLGRRRTVLRRDNAVAMDAACKAASELPALPPTRWVNQSRAVDSDPVQGREISLAGQHLLVGGRGARTQPSRRRGLGGAKLAPRSLGQVASRRQTSVRKSGRRLPTPDGLASADRRWRPRGCFEYELADEVQDGFWMLGGQHVACVGEAFEP